MTDEFDYGDDDFVVSGEGLSEDDVSSSNRDIAKIPCKGHWEVQSVKIDKRTKDDNGNPQSPFVNVACQLLATEKDGSPVGSFHYHKVYIAGSGGSSLDDFGREKYFRFAKALGLVEHAVINGVDCMVEAGTMDTSVRSSMWNKAVGRQFCAKLVLNKGKQKEDKKTGKKITDENGAPVFWPDRLEFPYGNAFAVNDPDVADWPKNMEAIKAAGISMEPTAPFDTSSKMSGNKKNNNKGKVKETVPPEDNGGSDDTDGI